MQIVTEGQDVKRALEGLRALGSAIAGRADAADVESLDRDLEQQIATLGLFPYEDWSLRHFPKELHSCCGHGLGIWQYPNQLLPLAILLNKYRVESYLEIGVAAGGTFTFMCELLSSWTKPGSFRALGCDPAPPGSVSYLPQNPFQERFKEWLAASPAVSYKQVYSEFLERQWLRDNEPPQSFDCVFVDGDHSYEGCWADLQMALRLHASIIILHDVVNAECPGVCDAWAEAQSALKNDFDFFEFSAQYESVAHEPGEQFLGIGVCVRKTMPRRSSE
ncbi:unnamed protein product [Polarella glacialis]|uniref:Class I SAM-dependent methyltransferase n=1 Tax=Polarella glacialis TaxID=89957 RepID=A0A813DP66_POLGL|nr:unnamed protein product [Polarella glacialis]|mmetsp:Transcript_37123/g.59794  ORF Transcript_37123/g.59794 Transcript_37123/m.59794 type:complete len:277 (+) Transcript_37123:92-922(+)